MQKITSAQNPLIKKIKKLGTSKKYRDEEGLIVLDGVHLVEEWIKQYAINNIEYVIVGESFLNDSEFKRFETLEDLIVVPDNLMKKIAPTKTPGGILAVVSKPEATIPASNDGTALILDHLQDPGNIGTILRTAVAAGCDRVFLYQCADIWSPKSLRAGQGAQFYPQMGLIEVEGPQDIRDQFDGRIYGMSLEKESQNFFNAKLLESHAFALGNEGQGLTKEIQALCDVFLYIPMQNNFESLNVGVTAGICLFGKS